MICGHEMNNGTEWNIEYALADFDGFSSGFQRK